VDNPKGCPRAVGNAERWPWPGTVHSPPGAGTPPSAPRFARCYCAPIHRALSTVVVMPVPGTCASPAFPLARPRSGRDRAQGRRGRWGSAGSRTFGTPRGSCASWGPREGAVPVPAAAGDSPSPGAARVESSWLRSVAQGGLPGERLVQQGCLILGGESQGRETAIWHTPLRKAREAADRLRRFWARSSPTWVDARVAMRRSPW